MYEGAKHPLDTGSNRLRTWFSVLGKTVATSTCEAEVNGAVVAAKGAVHIQRILVDLGVCDHHQHL